MSKYKKRSILFLRMERKTTTTLSICNVHLFQKAKYNNSPLSLLTRESHSKHIQVGNAEKCVYIAKTKDELIVLKIKRLLFVKSAKTE